MKLAEPLYHGIGLRISELLARKHTNGHANHLVHICHALALAFVQTKVNELSRELRFQGLSNSDIAFDCIGELFQQESPGNFVQLEAYFRGVDISSSSDEELLSHLRRLVFSKVNQGIFRIYNESDPSLGRIIRNIKLAVQSLDTFEALTRFGETCLVPCNCETLEHLPPMDRPQLEINLRSAMKSFGTIPQLLGFLSLSLRKQSEHSRIVSIVSIALVFRSLHQNQLNESSGATYMEDMFVENDSRKLIEETCARIKESTTAKYVGRTKVSAADFDVYFKVIEAQLIARIISNDGDDFSFYKGLKSCMPDLTEEDYRRKHRSKLEYLARLTHKKAVETLRSNL